MLVKNLVEVVVVIANSSHIVTKYPPGSGTGTDHAIDLCLKANVQFAFWVEKNGLRVFGKR
jgi:hypothetical protein